MIIFNSRWLEVYVYNCCNGVAHTLNVILTTAVSKEKFHCCWRSNKVSTSKQRGGGEKAVRHETAKNEAPIRHQLYSRI